MKFHSMLLQNLHPIYSYKQRVKTQNTLLRRCLKWKVCTYSKCDVLVQWLWWQLLVGRILQWPLADLASYPTQTWTDPGKSHFPGLFAWMGLTSSYFGTYFCKACFQMAHQSATWCHTDTSLSKSPINMNTFISFKIKLLSPEIYFPPIGNEEIFSNFGENFRF